MPKISISDIFEFAKIAAEVGAGVAAYATIKLNPVLDHPAEGLAMTFVTFIAVWIMGKTTAAFKSSTKFVQAPLLGLLTSFICYGVLQFLLSYIDANPPFKPWSTLADLAIQFTYASMFGLLTLSCCSLLRGIGISFRS